MACRPRLACIATLLSITVGACTSVGPPQVTSGTPQIETSAAAQSTTAPSETTATVSGDPTSVYALVARGIHACWFGSGGPLRSTHIFHAEASSPTQGGRAEIVIHERDVAMRDQRGPQALRVSMENAAGLVRVGIATIKLPPGYGEPMTRDVEAWAKGGAGCQLRASFPQPPEVIAQKPPGKPAAKPATKAAR